MDKLDDTQKEKIDLLQQKVNEYQQDPTLCVELTQQQCLILAELQTIYNVLSNKASSNIPSIYNTTCKGVKDSMKQFNTTYINSEAQELYNLYVDKYKEAKTGTTQLTKLLDIN